jgi:hypothetical protein
MGKKRVAALSALLALLAAAGGAQTALPPDPARAGIPLTVKGCSSFCLRNSNACVLGSNLDWTYSPCQLFVNKRGVAKSGWEKGETGEVARWVSKYGSVTFDYVGFQLTFSGMNEAGLAVSTMRLDQTRLPAPDARPPLTATLWLQYLLDTSATVGEALSMAALVRPTGDINHYFLVDRGGGCAAIEFLEGKMKVYVGAELPVEVLENRPYADCVRALAAGDEAFKDSRFAILAAARSSIAAFADSPATIDYAFYMLSIVSSSFTIESAVFDTRNLQVHFVSQRNRQRRSIDFGRLDFSAGSPVLMLDVHAALAGDITGKLLPYSRAAAFNHYRSSVYQWGGPEATDEKIKAVFAHLEGSAGGR